MQPLSGNQRPDLLTCLLEVSLGLRLPRKKAFVPILFKRPTPAINAENVTKPTRLAHF